MNKKEKYRETDQHPRSFDLKDDALDNLIAKKRT